VLEESLISAVSGAAAFGFAAYAVRGKSSSLIAPSVWHGDRKRPALALTFDDGPSESTPLVLELLARHNVKATFFMCGQNVRRLKEIARDVAADGHEIGNHTYSHMALYFRMPETIYKEIALAQDSIVDVAKVTPRLFRAPYGVRWPGVKLAQERLGLTGVMWTAIGRDWKLAASGISDRMTHTAANGAILCLHDGRELRPSPDIRPTIEALKYSLPILKERGFSFETVSQLVAT
jgi:peptidoglycan/xylan/chitin deacetylase (PgdA/CDA1 family)